MAQRQPNLLTRDDTFFGVCQALGEDFGFHPNFLRVAFGVPVIFFPMQVLTVYFGLGAVVLISRFLAPRPRRQAAAQASEAKPGTVQPQVPLDEDQHALPLAA